MFKKEYYNENHFNNSIDTHVRYIKQCKYYREANQEQRESFLKGIEALKLRFVPEITNAVNFHIKEYNNLLGIHNEDTKTFKRIANTLKELREYEDSDYE